MFTASSLVFVKKCVAFDFMQIDDSFLLYSIFIEIYSLLIKGEGIDSLSFHRIKDLSL